MAIRQNMLLKAKKHLEFDGGVVCDGEEEILISGAYIKVEKVSANKNCAEITLSIISQMVCVTRQYSFMPDLEGPNFIKQAYLHLKTLPEFADAEDC
jgi:hypothetical protein